MWHSAAKKKKNWGHVLFLMQVCLICESWTIKKAEHWRTDAFQLWCWRLLVPGQQGLTPVNLKGNQPWTLIGRTEAAAAATILWPHDAKSRLIGKDPEIGKDWRLKAEDEVVGWHHWLNGHELGQILEDGEGWGSLACCSPRDCEESDTILLVSFLHELFVFFYMLLMLLLLLSHFSHVWLCVTP